MASDKHRRAILVGHSDDLLKFYERSKTSGLVLGVFCESVATLPTDLTRLGDVSDVANYLDQDATVSCVYCSMTGISAAQISEIKDACKVRDVQFGLVLPLIDELEGQYVRRCSQGGSILAPVREPLSYFHNRLLKRVFDLLVTVTLMLTIFPIIYLFKLVGIKRREHAPSLVKERCCGPNGKEFDCMSFRFEDHSLARLLNVLTGSMSLVGPECYYLSIDNQSNEDTRGDEMMKLPKRLERKHVKSGLTGWARINHVDEGNRLEADIYYVENWSLWLDIKILFKSLF